MIRIENDEGITKLLKRNKKYKIEYDLNVYFQGLEYLKFIKLKPLILSLALAKLVNNIISDSLKKDEVIK